MNTKTNTLVSASALRSLAARNLCRAPPVPPAPGAIEALAPPPPAAQPSPAPPPSRSSSRRGSAASWRKTLPRCKRLPGPSRALAPSCAMSDTLADAITYGACRHPGRAQSKHRRGESRRDAQRHPSRLSSSSDQPRGDSSTAPARALPEIRPAAAKTATHGTIRPTGAPERPTLYARQQLSRKVPYVYGKVEKIVIDPKNPNWPRSGVDWAGDARHPGCTAIG